MTRDEGPSEADLKRLSGDTAYCPECGAEIWDQAEVCPECHEWIGGGAVSRKPLVRWWTARWTLLIIVMLIVIAILYWRSC